MTKHGQGKRNQPTCKSDRKPRSATLGFQKPTTPQDRWERNLAKLHAWVETKSCRELFDDELDRGDLACCECLCRRYYLPGAQAIGRWSKEELEGLLVGPNACTGYSREKVLPFMVDKAGTCYPSCLMLQGGREQFRILESLRKRTEMVYWRKVQRGEYN